MTSFYEWLFEVKKDTKKEISQQEFIDRLRKILTGDPEIKPPKIIYPTPDGRERT